MNLAARFLPPILLGFTLTFFGVLAPGFADWHTLLNIVVQSSSLAIVAAGMTVVQLTGGIDLSVGSVMYLSAAVAGKLALLGYSLGWCVLAVAAAGLTAGAINGALVVRFGVPAFLATLGLLYSVRGYTLYLTETRAMNLPDSVLRLSTGSILGIPVPVLLLMAIVFVVETALRKTPWGRQISAVGHSVEQARRAGLPVKLLMLSAYLLCALLAGLGGLLSVAQLGAVSPTFGNEREFAAIAAAVLGGTSLFGGRGNVFPGTVLGALLIQTVETGLVMWNANPYVYPVVMALVIFFAVLLDASRTEWLARAKRRTIRPIAATAEAR
jgi:ribose/xylose/arabinose/galactoside ABC-type transport system permease subunit